MTDKQPPANMKELRDRWGWGLSGNALKARAKALGFDCFDRVETPPTGPARRSNWASSFTNGCDKVTP